MNWFRIRLAGLFPVFLAATGSCSNHKDTPVGEPGAKTIETITETGQRTTAEGDNIHFALHIPPVEKQLVGKWPVVVLLHGFSRSHSRQVGNGRIIADAGMAVLVPDMTTLLTGEPGRRKNVEVLADHLNWLSDRNEDPTDPLYQRLDLRRVGLAGHSAGGGIALEFAVASLPNWQNTVDAIVLLDGVPWKPTISRIEEGNSRAALLSIRADESSWNAQGFVREAERAWKGEVTSVHLRGTTHIDPENPSDMFGDLLMHPSPPERRRQFSYLAAEFLAAELLGIREPLEQRLQALREGGDAIETP